MLSSTVIQTCHDYLNQGELADCLQELMAGTNPSLQVHKQATELHRRLNAVRNDFHAGLIEYAAFEQRRNQISKGAQELLEIRATSDTPLIRSLSWARYLLSFIIVVSLIFWFIAKESEKEGAFFSSELSFEEVEKEGKPLGILKVPYYFDTNERLETLHCEFILKDEFLSSYALEHDLKYQPTIDLKPINGKLPKNSYLTSYPTEEEKGRIARGGFQISSEKYMISIHFSKFPEIVNMQALVECLSVSGNFVSLEQQFDWRHVFAYQLGQRNLLFVFFLSTGLWIVNFSGLKILKK